MQSPPLSNWISPVISCCKNREQSFLLLFIVAHYFVYCESILSPIRILLHRVRVRKISAPPKAKVSGLYSMIRLSRVSGYCPNRFRNLQVFSVCCKSDAARYNKSPSCVDNNNEVTIEMPGLVSSCKIYISLQTIQRHLLAACKQWQKFPNLVISGKEKEFGQAANRCLWYLVLYEAAENAAPHICTENDKWLCINWQPLQPSTLPSWHGHPC